MFDRFRHKNPFAAALLLALIPAAAMTAALAFPMYRRWISANFFSFIISASTRKLHIAGEGALLWTLWAAFLLRGGAACAALFAFFLTLEFVPAAVCRAASGPWEFACLCLFPAFWTLTARALSRVPRGRAALWARRVWALIPVFGVTQYLVYLCYVVRFGRRPGANTLMTLLGTNLVEARDFFTDQFGLLPAAAGLAAFLAVLAFVWAMIRRCRPVRSAPAVLVLCALCLGAALYARTRARAYSNLFFDFQQGYRQYQTALDSLKKAHSDPSRRISRLDVSKEGAGEVCVVIVGESASRRHMARWGYRRPTTPWLCSPDADVQESLIALENAYSCMVHTEPAVTMALSQFSNYDPVLLLPAGNRENELMFTGVMSAFSLIEILEGAGVRTHWFSNQEKIGAYNNLISAQSRVASEQEFLEDLAPLSREDGHQDEELLPLLSRTLDAAGPGENHVIFLHLRGSHWSYKNSAPAAWPWLPPVRRQKNMKRETAERVDAYDRSLSYTDSILRRVAETLEKSKFGVASMLYFSDHGEDVTGVGHNFDAFRPVMSEIPVVIWLSKGYRERWPETAGQLRANAGRIFTSDLVCELALGLNHVSCANVIPERQFTSPRYGVTAQNARFWKGVLLKSAVPELKD